jgi:antirestriction protein ArdC
MAFDVNQAVTDRILSMLDEGTVPWRHPIKGGGQNDWPKNLASGKPYRGINVFLLAVTAWMQGYESSFWLSFKQAADRGGHIRKGEKSSMVVFWKQYETKDKETGEARTVPVLRYYNVFNAAQCEGIQAPDAPPPAAAPFEPIREAQAIVDGYAGGPKIEHAGGRACYFPLQDRVRIARPGLFLSSEFYYATLFHELVHSTGHSTRLDRGLDKTLAPFGSSDYSKEELVAEMGAAFLAAHAGISPPTIEQSAAYIEGWRKKLKDDKKLVVHAAGAGQRAAEWITANQRTADDSPSL